MTMRPKSAKANVSQIRQRTQYSCVAASISSCLAAYDKPVSEDDVNKVLGASPKRGANWEETSACLQYFGMRSTLIIPCTIEILKHWTDQGIPAIIGWNPEGRPWSHASVVFDVDKDNNVYVMDPNIPDPDETIRVVPPQEFNRKWVEKYSDTLLVRRPAMAVEIEVNTSGKPVKSWFLDKK